MSKALDNVLVVDTTMEWWAALGAALLGDFGARVVRVEKLPEARSCRLSCGNQPRPEGWDYRAELANRNKLSLAVNTDTAAGRRILDQLIGKADVFVTDKPLSVLQPRRLDYESLAAQRAGLIYAWGTGFGPKGEDCEAPALDEFAAARTGMMPILPQPDQPPVYPGHGLMYSTIMLALGVVTALYHRAETGEGQMVDASLLAGNMYGASLDLQAFLAIGGERFLHPVSRLDAGNPMSGTLYRSKDELWVTLTMPDTDRWWPALSEIVGIDTDDPRFNSHEKRCEVNRLELIALLEERFARQPADHWRRIFTARQMSADIIEEYSYPENDPQVRRNRYILDLDDSSLGPIKMIGFPIFMTYTPARLDRRAPSLGQHSAEILHELLGYSEREIVKLEEEGIVGR